MQGSSPHIPWLTQWYKCPSRQVWTLKKNTYVEWSTIWSPTVELPRLPIRADGFWRVWVGSKGTNNSNLVLCCNSAVCIFFWGPVYHSESLYSQVHLSSFHIPAATFESEPEALLITAELALNATLNLLLITAKGTAIFHADSVYSVEHLSFRPSKSSFLQFKQASVHRDTLSFASVSWIPSLSFASGAKHQTWQCVYSRFDAWITRNYLLISVLYVPKRLTQPFLQWWPLAYDGNMTFFIGTMMVCVLLSRLLFRWRTNFPETFGVLDALALAIIDQHTRPFLDMPDGPDSWWIVMSPNSVGILTISWHSQDIHPYHDGRYGYDDPTVHP